MKALDVVNAMLGTMGQLPLNTLEDPHPFRGACLAKIKQVNQLVQAQGWWFNTEKYTAAPQLNGTIVLPGDFIAVRCETRNLTQRGRYLYDLDSGTNQFTSSASLTVIRLVAFDDLPESASQYIGDLATLRFQSSYDGDGAKRRELEEAVKMSEAGCNADHIRNRKINFIESNTRLQRVKYATRNARRFIRSA